MSLYNFETLSNLVGEDVVVNDNQGNQVSLTLAEVNKSKLDGDKWEAFSAIYTGKNDFRISQGTYTFYHQNFGQEKIFLTPHSETEYETVVTRERLIPLDQA